MRLIKGKTRELTIEYVGRELQRIGGKLGCGAQYTCSDITTMINEIEELKNLLWVFAGKSLDEEKGREE